MIIISFIIMNGKGEQRRGGSCEGQGVGSCSCRSPVRKLDAWRLGREATVDRELVTGYKNSETSYPWSDTIPRQLWARVVELD